MKCGVVVPSLGGPGLATCLDTVRRLDPPATAVVAVVSGDRAANISTPDGVRRVNAIPRLGFAAAVNAGLAALPPGLDAAAIVNDDVLLQPRWLGRLAAHLDQHPRLAAVQGTVRTADGSRVDGRGVAFSRFGLPVQIDRGAPPTPEPSPGPQPVAVSLTAALLRRRALEEVAFPGTGAVLDEAFDSYHEDTDLGLRLMRLGWLAGWVPDAPCRHVGSSTGARLRWRHPWWLLANPWRVVAGNLTYDGVRRLKRRMAWGELRATLRLSLRNPVVLLVAPVVATKVRRIVAQASARETPGPRLQSLPGMPP